MTDAISRSSSSPYTSVSGDDSRDDERACTSRASTTSSKAPASYDVDPSTLVSSSYKPPMPASAKKQAPASAPHTASPSGHGKSSPVHVDKGHAHGTSDPSRPLNYQGEAHGPSVSVGGTHVTVGKASVDAEVSLKPYVRASATTVEASKTVGGVTLETKGPSAEVSLGVKATKDELSAGALAAASAAGKELKGEPPLLSAARAGYFGGAMKSVADHVEVVHTVGAEIGHGAGAEAGVKRTKEGGIEISARAMGPIAHHLDGLVGTKITLKP